MSDLAASGGYYIAMPGQVIVAHPATLTGSIGIYTGKMALGGTMTKLGVTTGKVTSGANADIYSPFEPFSPAQRTRVQDYMQGFYENFVEKAAEARRMTPEQIDAVAQGRVWTGRQAREHGLVDELGGLESAVRIAKERAKLDPKRDVDLVVYPPKRSILDILSNPLGSRAAQGLGIMLDRPEARLMDSAVSTLRRFRRGEPLGPNHWSCPAPKTSTNASAVHPDGRRRTTMGTHDQNVSKLAELITNLCGPRLSECYACGEWKPMTLHEHEHGWFDEGEHRVGMFCDECRAKRRHELMP